MDKLQTMQQLKPSEWTIYQDRLPLEYLLGILQGNITEIYREIKNPHIKRTIGKKYHSEQIFRNGSYNMRKPFDVVQYKGEGKDKDLCIWVELKDFAIDSIDRDNIIGAVKVSANQCFVFRLGKVLKMSSSLNDLLY